jgi:hypothetical protein
MTNHDKPNKKTGLSCPVFYFFVSLLFRLNHLRPNFDFLKQRFRKSETIKLTLAPNTAKIPEVKKSSVPRFGTREAKEPPATAILVWR